MESNSAPAVVWQFTMLKKGCVLNAKDFKVVSSTEQGFRRNYGASLVREENPPNFLCTMWLYIDHSNDHVACVASVPIRADRDRTPLNMGRWQKGRRSGVAGQSPQSSILLPPQFSRGPNTRKFVRAARFRWACTGMLRRLDDQVKCLT